MDKYYLPQYATISEAENYVREMVRTIGSGFHLATPPQAYSQAYGITADEASHLELGLFWASEILGPDLIYQIATDEVKRITNDETN